MEKIIGTTTFYDKLLARLGGTYFFWVSLIRLLIFDFVGILGIAYIYFATDLGYQKILTLSLTLFFFSTLSDIFISIFSIITTKNSRTMINNYFNKLTIGILDSSESNANLAWNEVYYLPSRFTYIVFFTKIILAIIPTIIISRLTININFFQTIHIVIGSFVSILLITIIHNISLDKILVPIRSILFSPDLFLSPKPAFLSRISTRMVGMVIFLIITTIILLAGIGFQRSINASLPGADISFEIRQFQIHSAILGVAMIIIGSILASYISKSISKPIINLLELLSMAQKAEYQHRASLTSCDETFQLSNQFNILLSKLQHSTSNLTDLIDEQTGHLMLRTNQLQMVTKILQEISRAENIESLLDKTVHLIADSFGFYHVGVYLSDNNSEFAILEAASSDGGKIMTARGLRYRIDKSNIIGLTISENKETLLQDISQDVSVAVNPDLPQTKSIFSVPLHSPGKTIGAIDFQSSSTNGFTEEDQELLLTLADQLTLTIRNIRLVEENRLALQRLESAFEDNIKKVWAETTIERNLSYKYTPTNLEAVDTSTTSLKINSDGDLLSVPIRLHGQVLGSINLVRNSTQPWDEADRSFATEISTQIGLALENVRLLNSTKQRMYLEQSLSELTGQLSQSIDTNTLLETAIRELHQIPNVTEVSVKLSPPETN